MIKRNKKQGRHPSLMNISHTNVLKGIDNVPLFFFFSLFPTLNQHVALRMLYERRCTDKEEWSIKANDIGSSLCLIDWRLHICFQKKKDHPILLFQKSSWMMLEKRALVFNGGDKWGRALIRIGATIAGRGGVPFLCQV